MTFTHLPTRGPGRQLGASLHMRTERLIPICAPRHDAAVLGDTHTVQWPDSSTSRRRDQQVKGSACYDDPDAEDQTLGVCTQVRPRPRLGPGNPFWFRAWILYVCLLSCFDAVSFHVVIGRDDFLPQSVPG